ncbi:hypothetical protein CsatB_027223 [Cannabis sativa]
MVVRSLDVEKDPFRPREEHKELLGPEVPYLSAIGALMYLANCTRPDIAFSVNLLARFSSTPTYRQWKLIKHIRYLQGTIDKGLFYSNNCGSQLIGYADAEYLSDIKPYLKLVICSLAVTLLYPGAQQSKLWWPLPQIKLRYLQFTRQVENVFG